MTFTINPEHVYLGVILLLMIIQVFQWRIIARLRKECDDIWTQIGTLAVSMTNQILGLQQDLNKKEDKKVG